MVDVLAVIAAWAVGSIVWGVVLGKLLFGRDPRAHDNPGASGSARTFGIGFGVVVGLLDLAKGFAAVGVARWFGASPTGTALAAGAAVAGHNWPIWLGFRGGGGLAAATGALASFGLRETATGVAAALLAALAYKHPKLYRKLPMSALPFGSMFGLPLLMWLFWRSGNYAGTMASGLATLLIGLRAIGMHAGSRVVPRNP